MPSGRQTTGARAGSIAIVDSTVAGETHAAFNSALLNVVRRCYPARRIEMHAKASHIAVLEAVSSLRDIEFEAIDRPERMSDPQEYADYVLAIPDLAHVVALGEQADKLRALRRQAKHRPQIGFDIVMHSELAEPAHWRSRNPWLRRRDMFGTLATRLPPNMRIVVLEPAIAALVRGVTHHKNTVTVFAHPVPEGTRGESRARRPSISKPLIAFIGGTFAVKGFDVFAQAARLCRGKFDFSVVGERFGHYEDVPDELFVAPPAPAKLPRPEFDRRVAEADLICLPLDGTRYSWAASGTLLDAVGFGLPVVTTRTAITSDWLQRYGRFGYVLDNKADIPAFLAGLAPQDLERDLPEFRQNLSKIARDRTIEQIARGFRLHDPGVRRPTRGA